MKTLLTTLAYLGMTVAVPALTPTLIPLPKTMTLGSGNFILCPTQPNPPQPGTASTMILVDAPSLANGQYLAAQLLKSTDYTFNLATNTGGTAVAGAILITTAGAPGGLGAEGYQLTVNANSVLIQATNQAGLFYGVQTLLQLLPPQVLSPAPVANVAFAAPCVVIQDQPRFPWRGWMLDCSRHFFTVPEVERMLDAMALHKLNTFHWHLVDDQGWRIQTPQYPLLTSVGAWRAGIDFGLNPRASSATNSSGQYGGYYTKSQITALVAYATARHITVVPEIEMPGHSTAGLAAYPQFGCVQSGFNMDNPNYNIDVYSPGTSGTMTFLENILTNVIALFPGKYIHCGGDEVVSSIWTTTPADETKMNSLGINPGSSTAVSQYQHWFSGQISSFLKSHGRTMVGWTEIENGGVLPNAVCMDWETGGGSTAIATAEAGQYVVRTPTSNCYINFYMNIGTGTTNAMEPPAQPGYLPLSSVYNFEPLPAGLPAQYNSFILGAEGNLWTEYVPSLLNVEFKSFPRMCAMAEVTWTPAALKNYTDFQHRLLTQNTRLDYMGINHDDSQAHPIGGWSPATITTVSQWGSSPANTTILNIDITSKLVQAGEVPISFCYTNGADALLTFSVALLKNGSQVDIDVHHGYTGAGFSDPTYILHLPSYSAADTYTIRASVCGWGGTATYGGIYLPNWD
jgi:hexosaminidase